MEQQNQTISGAQASQLRARIEILRAEAMGGGTMHANWDLIATAEDLLAGRGCWPYKSADAAFLAVMGRPA